ncbi:hypothetical protein SBA_ch2_2640 [Sphingomonas bisphenolicum]|uniref:Uronate isomerase n=1 Tax=Sphingomonas bisphenolicum TaxID=296544 RepID=A0ABM7G8Y8_9SPHN|nr:hypothetical protein SBA_ch2_2640 [Sphingomonas bisphenolicum]
MTHLSLDPNRLFPADPGTRAIARSLYDSVAALPIVSPHGHTDPAWFATNDAWDNATALLLAPDHYLYRMLYSQGVKLEDLGVPAHGVPGDADPRAAWRIFARNQHLFRGTPSRMWLDHVFAEVFGFDTILSEATADHYYDRIGELAQSARSCDFGHLGEHVGNGLVVVDDRPCEERRSAPIRERRYEPWRFEWGSDRLLEPEFFGHRVRDRQSGDGTTGIGGSA